MKRQFGITVEQYDELFKKQDGRCAICLRKQDDFDRRFPVDHDHSNGKVRSLLCISCNTMLGCAGDSTEILSKAIDYLKHHKQQIAILQSLTQEKG